MIPVTTKLMRVHARFAALQAPLAYHLPGIGLLASVTLWTMRRFVFSGGIPAGTDMLGFISRASQNASLGRLVDAWGPGSFGERRVFTFDNVLGAITLLTRNPMLTVKLLDVLVLFGAGLAAYMLSWSWYARRFTATTTGLLYMMSQASLTRWGSGQLNVEIVISLAPLMLLTWSSCIQRFTLSRASQFTLVMGIAFLIRADLVLYVFPFLVLYAVITLSRREARRNEWADTARTLAVAVPGVLLLNAAWLVPSLTGYRAQYETLSQIFDTGQLSSRSIDLYPSLLGFGREIGYFGFTGTETWFSYPGLPQWAYYAFAALIPVLAYSALRWHRDRRTVFLALASIVATLAAPGGRMPLGPLYLWTVQRVPFLDNLRDPNRWLIVQAVGYAVLASLTIERIATAASGEPGRRPRQSHTPLLASVISVSVTVSLIAVALVPVLPTLVIGLRTWHVTGAQRALLSQVRDAPGSSRVASIPFDQDYQYLIQGSYQGYEHDLGYESALFTGREDIGDGSWNQRSANFVAYEATLLDQGDPAFSAMLASVGVARAMSFNYPLVAAQPANTAVTANSQQHTASGLSGLTPLLTNSAGTDYQVKDAAAPLSFRRNIAVVLGGSQGMAALADRPGLNLSAWATFTADDVIETGGYRALLTLIRKADVVLLADERPTDVAVEGTTPLAQIAGITSDPQTDRLDSDVSTDQSAQTGSLDDPAIPIPQPGSTSSSSAFSIRSPQQEGIWARVLVSAGAATIEARVDGVRVGSITPVTLGTGGFEWVRLATVQVGAGTHQITISAAPSSFGDTYEVAESRVVNPGALRTAEGQLSQALAANADRVAYSFNLADVAKWSWPSLAHSLGPASVLASSQAWMVPTGAGTMTTTTIAPGDVRVPEFTARKGRSVYAIAKIRYRKPQNWADRPYIYLRFKGTGSGAHYRLSFDFGLGNNNEARYVITDNSSEWRTLAFSTAKPGPGSGKTDWPQVESVRIALASKSESGTFALSTPRPSMVINSLTVPLPVIPGTIKSGAAVREPMCFAGPATPAPRWLTSGRALVLPVSSMRSTCSIYISSRTGYKQLPATAVNLQRTGTENWSYSFSAGQPGVLVWTQAYDPLWKLSGTSASSVALPVLSLLDGYLVGSGHHAGTIAFAGESSTIIGVVVTLLAMLILLVLTFLGLRKEWSNRSAPVMTTHVTRERSDLLPPPLRRASDLGLLAGIVLLAISPFVSLASLSKFLIPLCLLALFAFGVTAASIAFGRPWASSSAPYPAAPSENQDLNDPAD